MHPQERMIGSLPDRKDLYETTPSEVEGRSFFYDHLSSGNSSEGEAPNEESEEERNEKNVEEEIKKLETLDFAVVLVALKNGVSYTSQESNRRKRPLEYDSDNSDCFTGDEEDFLEDDHKFPSEDLNAYHTDDEDWQGSLYRMSPTSKNSRKKAPSGTACEKHKRWKKRCPEDCPMRIISKYRRINPQSPFKAQPRVQMEEEDSYPEKPARTDSTRQAMSHFSRQSKYSDSASEFSRSDRKKVRNAKSSRRKRAYLLNTIACEYHTMLHARCPPNCPDRRPAKPHSRSKPEKDEKNWEKEDMYDSMDESLPEDFEDTENSSKRKNKKYMASACERHKLLHSRCPSNCPDRAIKDRDIEAAPSAVASH